MVMNAPTAVRAANRAIRVKSLILERCCMVIFLAFSLQNVSTVTNYIRYLLFCQDKIPRQTKEN